MNRFQRWIWCLIVVFVAGTPAGAAINADCCDTAVVPVTSECHGVQKALHAASVGDEDVAVGAARSGELCRMDHVGLRPASVRADRIALEVLMIPGVAADLVRAAAARDATLRFGDPPPERPFSAPHWLTEQTLLL